MKESNIYHKKTEKLISTLHIDFLLNIAHNDFYKMTGKGLYSKICVAKVSNVSLLKQVMNPLT
jgi:hypothetical protein